MARLLRRTFAKAVAPKPSIYVAFSYVVVGLRSLEAHASPRPLQAKSYTLMAAILVG